MYRVFLPPMLVAIVACQPGAGPLTDADVAALRDLGQAYVQGFLANDGEAVAAVYAAGAVEMPPSLPDRDGVDAIRVAYSSYFATGVETTDFTMTANEIDGIGSEAFDRGTWSWTGREGGGTEPVTQSGKYLAIARRQEDGSWRYTAMIWNSDTALPAPK